MKSVTFDLEKNKYLQYKPGQGPLGMIIPDNTISVFGSNYAIQRDDGDFSSLSVRNKAAHKKTNLFAHSLSGMFSKLRHVSFS